MGAFSFDGGEEVETFDGAGAVGEALGRAEALAEELAVGVEAAEDLLEVGGGVDGLVVGFVEGFLVEIEPDGLSVGERNSHAAENEAGC